MKIIPFGNDALGLTYSPLQEVILLTAAGEPLDDTQAALFARHAGRPYVEVEEAPSEVHAICGRQGGKTGYLAATLVLYAALDPRTVEGLSPGYWRDVVLVAPTQRQSRIAYQRIRGLVDTRPGLKRYLRQEPTQHEIEFTFGVRIGIWASKGATMRGLQPRLLLLDEACFLPAEGGGADYQIIEACKPGMAMVPGGQVVSISSPWIESGYVYETYRHRADLEGIVVFQAASWELNPHIPQAFLDRERKRDPLYFQREFAGEFIGSISAYLPSESITACTVNGRSCLPPEHGIRYAAALDAAYKQDQFVLAIAHKEGDRMVVDSIKGWAPSHGKPLRLDSLLPEIKDELSRYGLRCVHGDQFGAEPFREVLRNAGLVYQEKTFTAESKRNIYSALKTAITEEALELLDHAPSLRELRCLEATALPGGGVRIEAPRGAGFSDDYADTLAILAHELRPSVTPGYVAVGVGPEDAPLQDNILTAQF